MNKKNLYLGGILLILVLGTWLFNGPVKRWQDEWGKADNFFAKLDFSQFNRIEIVQGEDTLRLILTDNKWLIEDTKDFFVDEETVILIKTALEKARDGENELVGENPEKKDEFGTDTSGTTIRLKQGEDTLYEFVQGKASSDFTSSYFSPQGQNKTYLSASNLNNAFVRADWYDKIIFSSDEKKIDKIRFQYPDIEFIVEKKEDSVQSTEDEKTYFWEGTKPYKFSVDEEKIKDMLELMTGLEASSIPAQTFEGTGLEKNLIIVEATGEDVINTIMIGTSVGEDEENVEYYAKRGDSDNIYLISADDQALLDTSIRELR